MAPARIRRCSEILEEHISEAVQSRESMRALLQEIAMVSAPDTGGPKILPLLARLATPACTWFEGEPRIEIVPERRGCSVRILSDNAGIRERALPVVALDVPFEEIVSALARIPQLAAPLIPRLDDDLLVLAQFHDEDDLGVHDMIAFAEEEELPPVVMVPPKPTPERPSQRPTVPRMQAINPDDFKIPTPIPPKPKPKQEAARANKPIPPKDRR